MEPQRAYRDHRDRAPEEELRALKGRPGCKVPREMMGVTEIKAAKARPVVGFKVLKGHKVQQESGLQAHKVYRGRARQALKDQQVRVLRSWTSRL